MDQINTTIYRGFFIKTIYLSDDRIDVKNDVKLLNYRPTLPPNQSFRPVNGTQASSLRFGHPTRKLKQTPCNPASSRQFNNTKNNPQLH